MTKGIYDIVFEYVISKIVEYVLHYTDDKVIRVGDFENWLRHDFSNDVIELVYCSNYKNFYSEIYKRVKEINIWKN